jgi:anti-sigma-K factor RskA
MSRPEQESLLELAPAYTLGALSADEARRFEAFLATSPEAQRQVDEFREVAALLALTGADASPPDTLRDRMLARVAQQKLRPLVPAAAAGEPSARARRSPLLPLALAASLIAAVGLGLGLIATRGRLGALETELALRDSLVAETQQRLAEREATLNAILEPGVRLFQLTATGDPDPGIQLFYNQEQHKAIVHGFRIKGLPAGRAYQLWFIKDGKPVPSVTFKPEPDGHVSVESIPVPADGNLSAAAVTVEPEAGSAQPTSPIVLVGTLQKS